MRKCSIGFIGGGNMAASLIGGLVADGCDPSSLWVSDLNNDSLQRLKKQFAINTTSDNSVVVENVDSIVIAVKPQVVKPVAEQIGVQVRAHRTLVISIAAGIRESDLSRWLGDGVAIVRTMPNTPAMVQTGATALFANRYVSEQQAELAEGVMRAVGIALWVEDERQMDAVTALSGSGPAYFFYVMEAMINAGIAMGLEPETARLLTLQTASGASKLAMESDDPPGLLREKVTSKGGTTEQALKVLAQGQLDKLFNSALEAARHRSEELARQYGTEA